jgi:hypothetical protein
MRRPDRRAKGINFIELIKLLKVQRRTRRLDGLSQASIALLDERILLTAWYPAEPFIELIDYVYRHMLSERPERAFELGALGAELQLTGPHRAFVVCGDPEASVLGLRHIWRSYFDFGECDAVLEAPGSALFSLRDYRDMPAAHGVMLPAYEIVAARLAGSHNPTYELLKCPWLGEPALIYRVRF